MFKFKMIDNEVCEICGEIETIKHAIWECTRARVVWQSIGRLMEIISNDITITFDALFVGFKPTNTVLESIITKLTQSLLSFDRTNMICEQNVKNIVYNFALLNKHKVKTKKSDNDVTLWEKTIEWSKTV